MCLVVLMLPAYLIMLIRFQIYITNDNHLHLKPIQKLELFINTFLLYNYCIYFLTPPLACTQPLVDPFSPIHSAHCLSADQGPYTMFTNPSLT